MMTNYNKILESTRKVRFQDCDPFNHLNNSKYIDYILDAREDQLLDNYNLDIYKLAKQEGLGWVVVQTQVSYFTPATPTEEVRIQTALIEYTDKSLVMEGIMWNNDLTIPRAMMWTRFVHFNLVAQKSAVHPQHLMDLFQAVLQPVDGDFESRAKQVRQGNSAKLQTQG
jgi:YbgC/YbaW family acyl-CoA thioester hydrolase